MDTIPYESQSQQQGSMLMTQAEGPHEAPSSCLPLPPLYLHEPAILQPSCLSHEEFISQPMHLPYAMPGDPWGVGPLEAGLALIPSKSLRPQQSPPATELQGTDPNLNAVARSKSWQTTVSNDPSVDYAGLATTESVQSSTAPMPHAEKIDAPSRSSSSHSETSTVAPNNRRRRVRFGVYLRGEETMKMHDRASSSSKDSSDGDAIKLRDRHNRVEKNYRDRLNHRFLSLLKVLLRDQTPQGQRTGEKFDALSRGAVLDMACERIKSLEAENGILKLSTKTYDDSGNIYGVWNVHSSTEKQMS